MRVQFNTPIGYFEGIEEALARIGGNAYMMDAARVMTAGAVDLGEKPSVISAIVKYHLTERARQAVNDAMDIHGGKGICIGPRNYLGRSYQHIPVSITVEGANILTRSMIIFGQGAIRCHPYILQEVTAANDTDKKRASKIFDAALAGHVLFSMRNTMNSIVYGLFGKYMKGSVPENSSPEIANYYQQLTRLSVNFAFLADIALMFLGGALKRKERLSARLGDILSYLYLCSATLKRFEDDGRPQADLPLLHWSMQDAVYRIQQTFEEVLSNFPANKVFVWLLRKWIFPVGKPYSPPTDDLGHEIARIMLEPGEARDRLTSGIFIPTTPGDPMSDLEEALKCAIESAPLESKVRNAVKSGKVTAQGDKQITQAYHLNVITAAEAELLKKMKELRSRVIKVDDFSQDIAYEPFNLSNQSALAASTESELEQFEPEQVNQPEDDASENPAISGIEQSKLFESGQLSEIAASDLFTDTKPVQPNSEDKEIPSPDSETEKHKKAAPAEQATASDSAPSGNKAGEENQQSGDSNADKSQTNQAK